MGQLPIMFFIPGRVAQKSLASDPVPPALRAFRRLSLRSSLLQARRAGSVRLCSHTRPGLLAHCSPLLAARQLIWKSLKTDRISVAKLRLGDFHKEERQRAATQTAVARGNMTFGDCLELFKTRLGSYGRSCEIFASSLVGNDFYT